MEQNFIENELIIFTKQTYDAFLKSDNPAELIALYSFYYYTAKWQKTNQPKCTTGYAANGLKWSESKIRKFKKELIDLGLIEDVALRDEHNKIAGHYIKLNYILKQSTLEESHTIENPQCGNSDSVEEKGTNALSANNINALSVNNKNDDTGKSKKASLSKQIDEIIEAYKSICKSYTKIKVISAERKKDIEKSLKTLTVEQIKECFELAEHNYLLKGMIMEGKDGKEPWKASFDWLIQEKNLVKIFNENYAEYDDRVYDINKGGNNNGGTQQKPKPEVDVSAMTFEELEEYQANGGTW